MPPEVELRGPEIVVRGKSQEFSAVIRDPNDDVSRMKVVWFMRDLATGGGCPENLAAAQADPATQVSTRPTMSFLPDHNGFYCLWVVVTDSDGASGFARRQFVIMNNAPSALIQLLAPTPLRWVGMAAYVSLYTQARMSARGSEDPEGDMLSYVWTIRGRNGETIPPSVCAGASGLTEICHRLDQPGDYRFQLDVSDGELASAFVLPVSVMPDAPPCVQQTEPSYTIPRVVAFSAERTNIRVIEVKDDGDPFPAATGQLSQAAFVWRFRYLGAPEFNRLVSTTMPVLSFAPETFRPGDQVEVRVDVFDRVIDRDFRACEGKSECELEPGSGCPQRVSWEVSFL